MFPVRDDNPTLRTPVVTIALVAITLGIWLVVQGGGTSPRLPESICELGLVPGNLMGAITGGSSFRVSERMTCVLSSAPAWHTVVTSMFMHGGWMHVLGNLWFLWVFGNNVEDSMGRLRFIVFYVTCGLAAAAAQIATNPTSAVPMVGASGAIGGIMGAYVVLYPRVRVHMLLVLGFYVTTFYVPAFVMLGYWFALQLLGGLPSLGSATGGVAFWAHIGGFVSGAVLIPLFRKRELVDAHRRVLAGHGY